MCGRYASSRRRPELLTEFGIHAENADPEREPDYNIAPRKQVYGVLERGPRGGEAEAHDPVRQLRTLQWGLVPFWAKDSTIGAKMINARVETVATKPAYRKAFARQRCLLPADGWYEWHTGEPQQDAKPVKQPYFLRPSDGSILAMAGLYELWRDPAVADGDPAAWLVTCTVITTQATDDLGHIHQRMPMIIDRDRWDAWLNPNLTSPDDIHALLAPATAGELQAYPVSRAVGNVRNNGPGLLDPLPADQTPGTT